MSRVIENTAFPSAMEVKLRRILWRQVGVATVRAVAITVSVLIAAMLIAMFVDWWFTLFNTGVRTALTVTSFSLAIAAFVTIGIRPVIRAFGWMRAANVTDAEVPQLEERWTTISHFAMSEHQPTTTVTKAMLAQVASEAVALEPLVKPASVVRVARLKRVVMATVGCTAVLVGFLAVNWDQNSVLLRRFWAPTAPISATRLESVTGDAIVPRGQSIDIVTRLAGVQRSAATLAIVTDSGESESVVLDRELDASEVFVHRFDVDQSFHYRVRSGDGQTKWHTITAIDPPEISDVRFEIAAPDYVGRPPNEKTLLPGRVKAIQGSRLTLEMRSAADLASFELLLTSKDETDAPTQQTLVLTASSDGWYRYETLLEHDLSLSPILHSPYGLSNEDRRTCRIRVIADKAPVARVISPTDEISVSPNEEIDIKFEAHDDHGIAKAELVVYRENEDGEQEVLSVQEIPIDDQQLRKHILGETKLDLSKFDLNTGTHISYAIRVTDNRMMNLDRQDASLAKGTGGKPKEPESESTDDAQTDSDALAQSSESNQSKEGGDSPSAGQIKAEPTALAAGLDRDANQSKESGELPSAGQIKTEPTALAAGADSDANQSLDPEASANGSRSKAISSAQPDAASDVDSNESSDNTQSIAESGKDRQQVTDQEQVAIAQAASQGTPGKVDDETRDPSVPTLAEADEKPASADDSDAGEKTAAAEAPGSRNDDTPDRDQPEASAVAAAATAEDTADPSASPAGSPSSPPAENDDAQVAQGDSGSPARSENRSPDADPKDSLAGTFPEQPKRDPLPQSGSVQMTEVGKTNSLTSMPPLDLQRDMNFETQRGQDTESNRMLVRITDRLAVAAEAGEGRQSDSMNTRELLEEIDKQLEVAETKLLDLNQGPEASEAARQARQIDSRLKESELIIADLRIESKETKYEFVGLQMLDISRTQLTPARDRMFVLIQDPGSNPARNILEALHHTSSARELLAALAKQFEEVARERELADSLEEVAEFYEVYVENMQNVLRAAQQNRNPMTRKMAIVEVDEDYLQRYADVLEMRREVMAEFGRILSDDPRLLGKYMDLIKRRRNNLRRQLTELHERQAEMAYELSGWLRVDQARRPDVWTQIAETRLLAVKDLVRDASQLEARTLSQLPLNLEPTAGTSGQVVQYAEEVALNARKSSMTSRTLRNDALENEDAKGDLLVIADDLIYQLSELDAVLEQLSFQHEGNDDVRLFVAKRLAESRGVSEQAVAWAEIASHVRHDRFHGLAAVDQQQLAIDTDRLRIAMADIEDDLGGLFQPDGVPPEVTNIIRELLAVVEAITFNQAAATYDLNREQLPKAEAQQTMATEGFARAEELFDKMRRTVADILDEREVDDPDIAALEDPTIDEFLERLEREPNLNQLLGIPNRPSNLRVVRDWMLWQTQGAGQEGTAAQQAAANAKQRAEEIAQRRGGVKQERPAANDRDLSEDEMQKFAKAENMEEEMDKMLRAIEEKIKDPATGEKQRQELKKKAEMLAQMLQEAREGGLSRDKWVEMANADEMKAMMEALAKGLPIPDSQWNRLLSTLDTGLWQVRGRTPPEDYRKPIEQYQDLIRRVLNAETF